MNWIKNSLLLLSTIIFCFGLLIIGDFLLVKIRSNQLINHQEYVEGKKIENTRRIEEDIPQREKAILDGFSPTVYPNLMDDMNLQYPLIAGLPLTDTYFCNEGYGLIRYKSDRFGFRNDDALWERNNKQLMIGDSFVQGGCVMDDETLPSKLSHILNSNIINLGMGSNNTSHYYTYAELFIPKFSPETVYLVFFPNDYGHNHISVIEQKYVDQKIEIFSKTKDTLFDVNVFKEGGEKAIQFARNNGERTFYTKLYGALIRHSKLPNIRSILSQIYDTNFFGTEKAITRTLDLCNKYDCKLIVAFIPNSNFYNPDSHADEYGNKISKLTEHLEIQFVDGRKFINREKNSLDFAIKGGHLSPLGYEKMAIAISNIVQ